VIEEPRSINRLKGSVRYGRVIPLGNSRTLTVEWSEEFFIGETTAEKVTFAIESRMKRTLQEAGVVN
jgi:hypothetical protein